MLVIGYRTSERTPARAGDARDRTRPSTVGSGLARARSRGRGGAAPPLPPARPRPRACGQYSSIRLRLPCTCGCECAARSAGLSSLSLSGLRSRGSDGVWDWASSRLSTREEERFPTISLQTHSNLGFGDSLFRTRQRARSRARPAHAIAKIRSRAINEYRYKGYIVIEIARALSPLQ
jgi:hypothetical protein